MSSPQTPSALKSADLDDLRQQQLDALTTDDGQGEIPHRAGNTPAGEAYALPTHEADRMHVELVTSTANPATRLFEDEKKTVKLSPQEFERMEANDSFAQYDEVNILHDCRPKARQLADKKGDSKTGSPAQPVGPITTLNDAQMRYFDLAKEKAPTNKSLEELLELIAPLEEKLKATKTTPQGLAADKKPLRTKADYQARYKELAGQEAPADKSIDELKEAIAHFEAEAAKK